MTEKNDLNLVVTEERVRDVPLELFYNLENGSPKIMIDYIAFFVANEKGEYLPEDEAILKVLTGRRLRDLEDIAEQLKDAVESSLVPNE